MLRQIINELLQLHRLVLKKDATKIAEKTKALQVILEESLIAGTITDVQKQLVLQLLVSMAPDKKIEAFPVPAGMQEYKSFKSKLYQEIYPYLLLAYEFEKNGDTAEHASKLACMFNTTLEVLQYLNEYAVQKPKASEFVYDACLFSLPETSANTEHWLKLAKNKDNLFSPDFLTLLPLSLDIEQQIALDEENKTTLLAELQERYKLAEVKAIAARITAEIKPLQKECDKFAAGHGEDRTLENAEKNAERLVKLSQLYSDRALTHLFLKKDFTQYRVRDLTDIHERLLARLKPNDKFLVTHGIDKKNRDIFWQLDRKQAGKNIPDVFIDCSNGFYIKKLNVQDDNEAVIAACAGALSNCCQNLGNKFGHACTIHGLTAINSGLYVLFKGDPKKPSVNDTVWGQAWVNRTASGGLVLDSIESAQCKRHPILAKIVTAAYRNLANELITAADVPWVHCGTKSGISTQVGITANYQNIAEAPLNYNGPRDSATQLLLADKRLLFNLSTNEDKLLLDEKGITKQLEELKEKAPLPEKLRFTLIFLIRNSKIPEIVQLVAKFPESYHPAIKQYILLNSKIFKWAKTYNRHSKLLTELESEKKNPNIDPGILNNLLFKAVEFGHADIVKSILEYSNKPDINAQNELGNTLLAIAVSCRYKSIVEMLLQAEPKPDLNITNLNGDTVLISAVKRGDEDMLTLLLAAKPRPDINFKNTEGRTALQVAEEAGYPKIVQLLKDFAHPSKLPATKLKISTTPVTSGLSIFLEESKSPTATDQERLPPQAIPTVPTVSSTIAT